MDRVELWHVWLALKRPRRDVDTIAVNVVEGDQAMRVATFLPVAAIAAAASIGPALAYGPAASGPSLSYLTSGPEAASPKAMNQQTQVAFAVLKWGTNGYVLVKGDNGKEFPNCEKRANCYTEIPKWEFEGVIVNCETAKGCLVIGKE